MKHMGLSKEDPSTSLDDRSLEDTAVWRSWEEDIHYRWPTDIFASGAVAGILFTRKGHYIFSR